MPANINNVTFTAPWRARIPSIDGPGDLAGANLEGVFYFDGGDNQGWTISNLTLINSDLSIGMFYCKIDVFSNTAINNNVINMVNRFNNATFKTCRCESKTLAQTIFWNQIKPFPIMYLI